MVRIITDSTACLTRQWALAHGVAVVPLTLSSQGEEWTDGYAGETPVVFQDKGNTFRTSQPPVEKFVDAFQKAAEDGGEMVAILISEGISGTMNSARLARESMAQPHRIHLVDTGNTAIVTKYLVERAVEMAESGASAAEIVAEVEDQKLRSNVFVAAKSLDYLHYGGRLTRTQALLGNLLHISPIVTVREGKVAMMGKVRLFRRAIQEMVDQVPATTYRLGVAHMECPQELQALIQGLKARFPHIEIGMEQLSPVIAAHLGPCLGLAFQWA